MRNLSHFWDGSAGGLLSAWQSSGYFSTASSYAASHLGDLAFILLARAPFYVALFLIVGGWWLPEFRRLPKISDEHYSGLWLAVGLTFLLAWIITGVLWPLERSPILWFDQMRYVVMANVVILWIAMREADVDASLFFKKFAAVTGVFLLIGVVGFAQPKLAVFDVYDALREQAPPGSVIAIDGLQRYEVMVNVGPDHTFVQWQTGVQADFVVSLNPALAPANYTLVMVGHTDGSILGPAADAAFWRHA